MLNPARRDEVPARRPFIRPQQTIAAEQPPVVAHSADSGWGASLPAKAPARSVRNLTRNSISPTRPARPPAMDHRDDVGKVGDTIDPIKWLRRRKPCWSWRSSCACHAGGVPDISRGLSDHRERHPRITVDKSPAPDFASFAKRKSSARALRRMTLAAFPCHLHQSRFNSPDTHDRTNSHI